MLRMIARSLLAAILFISACSGDDAAPDPRSDAGGASDAASAAPDTGTARDAGEMDAPAEMSDGGTPPSDTSACGYLDLEIFIVSCASGYEYLRRWDPLSGVSEACPVYYTLDGVRFETAEDALTNAECDLDCRRAPATSVTLVRCGHRTGYIVYEDRDESCAPVYETPDGLFASEAEWEAAAPCPP